MERNCGRALFCEICLDECIVGREQVEEANTLMHEIIGGIERYTPICDRHAAAARRYRVAHGISKALPLGAVLQ